MFIAVPAVPHVGDDRRGLLPVDSTEHAPDHLIEDDRARRRARDQRGTGKRQIDALEQHADRDDDSVLGAVEPAAKPIVEHLAALRVNAPDRALVLKERLLDRLCAVDRGGEDQRPAPALAMGHVVGDDRTVSLLALADHPQHGRRRIVASLPAAGELIGERERDLAVERLFGFTPS